MKTFKRCFILTMVILFSACADKRPVLYPNAHLKQVGHAAAQADIDDCIQYAADNDAASNKGEEIAKDTAGGAAVGGAVGAATGAVLGNLGRGAAAGAAGGAAAGATRTILKSGDPDPVFKNFVNRCLKEKGYEPIGWR
jgi:outer membrane lipoprotein SlyB